MTTPIEVRGLSKRFGKVIALDRVDLTVDAGEFLVLLGPSGCGKTTLLRCIAGLETPNEGEIVIGDQVVFSAEKGLSVPPGSRKVGMVFQSYALWPHMKVYENIGFGLQVQKIPRREVYERVDRVLENLSMPGLGDRYPSELSGGQQQRVALARLLATKPPVFLMDEPLSNLDARLRVDMRSELKRLHHDSGATTVYVTHDQTEAMTMASVVVVMKDGKIQQVAASKDLYRQPANLFVAEFVGMPRVNLLSMKAVSENGQPYLVGSGFRLPVPQVPPRNEIVLASQPEDISLFLEPEPGAVEFQVYSVQPAGHEELVEVRRGDTDLIIRVSDLVDLKMDQTVWVKIDPSVANLYDKASGALLT